MGGATGEGTIAVVVPCFDDGAFLARAVESVLAQSRPADAIVIVDDGSRDATPEVAASLRSGRESLVDVVCQENRGVSAARNAGLDRVTTERVVFLDADDELRPDALSHYAKAPAGRWWIGDFAVERDGHVRERKPLLPPDRRRRFAGLLDRRTRLGNVSNMCFESALLRELRFDEALEISEDLVLFALLVTLTDPVLLDVSVSLQHRRAGSLRSRATLEYLTANPVEDAIFAHPRLPAEYRREAPRYRAQRARTLGTLAWRAGDYARASQSFATMVRHQPLTLRDPKLLLRYVVSRWRGAANPR